MALMAGASDPARNSGIFATMLREHIRRELTAELQAIATPIIAAAVDLALRDLETEITAVVQRESGTYIAEVVVRLKNEVGR